VESGRLGKEAAEAWAESMEERATEATSLGFMRDLQDRYDELALNEQEKLDQWRKEQMSVANQFRNEPYYDEIVSLIQGIYNLQQKQATEEGGWIKELQMRIFDLKSEIKGGASVDELVANKLVPLMQEFSDLGSDDYERQVDLLEDQYRVLEQIRQIQTEQLQETIRNYQAIQDTILELQGGSLAPVQSKAFFDKRYQQLLSEAQGGDTGAISDLNNFVKKYAEFMQSYGGDYNEFTQGVISDLQSLQDDITGGTTLGDLEARLKDLNEGILANVPKDMSDIISQLNSISAALGGEAVGGGGSGGAGGGSGGAGGGSGGGSGNAGGAPFTTGAGEFAYAVKKTEDGLYEAYGSPISNVNLDAMKYWAKEDLYYDPGICDRGIPNIRLYTPSEAQAEGLKLPNDVPNYASGGFPRGLSWAGEKGAELVEFPAGSRVHSNDDSKRMMRDIMAEVAGDKTGKTIQINWNVDRKTLASVVVDLMRYDEDVGTQLSNMVGKEVASNG
jgi:hypothetical protein